MRINSRREGRSTIWGMSLSKFKPWFLFREEEEVERSVWGLRKRRLPLQSSSTRIP